MWLFVAYRNMFMCVLHLLPTAGNHRNQWCWGPLTWLSQNNKLALRVCVCVHLMLFSHLISLIFYWAVFCRDDFFLVPRSSLESFTATQLDKLITALKGATGQICLTLHLWFKLCGQHAWLCVLIRDIFSVHSADNVSCPNSIEFLRCVLETSSHRSVGGKNGGALLHI